MNSDYDMMYAVLSRAEILFEFGVTQHAFADDADADTNRPKHRFIQIVGCNQTEDKNFKSESGDYRDTANTYLFDVDSGKLLGVHSGFEREWYPEK